MAVAAVASADGRSAVRPLPPELAAADPTDADPVLAAGVALRLVAGRAEVPLLAEALVLPNAGPEHAAERGALVHFAGGSLPAGEARALVRAGADPAVLARGSTLPHRAVARLRPARIAGAGVRSDAASVGGTVVRALGDVAELALPALLAIAVDVEEGVNVPDAVAVDTRGNTGQLRLAKLPNPSGFAAAGFRVSLDTGSVRSAGLVAALWGNLAVCTGPASVADALFEAFGCLVADAVPAAVYWRLARRFRSPFAAGTVITVDTLAEPVQAVVLVAALPPVEAGEIAIRKSALRVVPPSSVTLAESRGVAGSATVAVAGADTRRGALAVRTAAGADWSGAVVPSPVSAAHTGVRPVAGVAVVVARPWVGVVHSVAAPEVAVVAKVPVVTEADVEERLNVVQASGKAVAVAVDRGVVELAGGTIPGRDAAAVAWSSAGTTIGASRIAERNVAVFSAVARRAARSCSPRTRLEAGLVLGHTHIEVAFRSEVAVAAISFREAQSETLNIATRSRAALARTPGGRNTRGDRKHRSNAFQEFGLAILWTVNNRRDLTVLPGPPTVAVALVLVHAVAVPRAGKRRDRAVVKRRNSVAIHRILAVRTNGSGTAPAGVLLDACTSCTANVLGITPDASTSERDRAGDVSGLHGIQFLRVRSQGRDGVPKPHQPDSTALHDSSSGEKHLSPSSQRNVRSRQATVWIEHADGRLLHSHHDLVRTRDWPVVKLLPTEGHNAAATSSALNEESGVRIQGVFRDHNV